MSKLPISAALYAGLYGRRWAVILKIISRSVGLWLTDVKAIFVSWVRPSAFF